MMQIQKVTAVYYSATGNTAFAVQCVAKAISEALGVSLELLDITLPSARTETHRFSPEDLIVAGTAVYAGKVPNKLLAYWKENLKADGALAVPIVTFGNRSFDNGLAELCSCLEDNGFRTIAAGAFVMPHVFSDKIAADRPDARDQALMEQLAQSAVSRMQGKMPFSSVQIPGNADAPYYTPLGTDGKPAVFLKAKPKTAENCDSCGICASVCPMGSIPKDSPKDVAGICIKCQACVKKCPKHAKYFDDAAFLSHVAMLEENYLRRAESVIF